MRRSGAGRHGPPKRCWISVCVLVGVTCAHATQAADCDTDGLEDEDAIRAGVASDCNANGIPDACEEVPIELGLGQATLSVPSIPRLIASSDLDGDGDEDLVQASRGGSSTQLTWIENLGERSFVAEPVELDALVRSLAVADVDGDGQGDVLTANDRSLTLIRGGAEAPVSMDPGIRTRVLTVGDFTGDHLPDVAIAEHLGSQVGILVNDGEGTFASPRLTSVTDRALALAAADFDGDGLLDLASTNGGSETFSILRGNGEGGLELIEEPPLLDNFPLSLESGDLDGDGASDLVATTSSGLVVLLTRGSGTFREPTAYRAPGTRAASVGDLDGDGVHDLVSTLRPETLLVRRNDGRGEFRLVETWTGQLTEPMGVTVGDYDQNGMSDLAVLTANPGTIQFFWNGELDRGLAVRRETIHLERCANLSACRPHAGAMADVDGDGDPDIIASIPWPASLSVGINEGGRFRMLENRSYRGGQSRSADTGDLDGDGTIDLVTVDNSQALMRSHRGRGDGTFEVVDTAAVGAGPIRVRLADFDTDGHLDAAAASPGDGSVTLLFQQGDLRFAPHADQPELRFLRPRSMVGLDADGDGDQDLAVAHAGATNVSTFSNPGDGVFRETPVSLPLSSVANAIRAGDVDGDNALDLVVAVTSASVAVLLNRGDGTFREGREYPAGWIPDTMVLIDFDADGALDIATGSETSSNVSVLLGRGDGTFLKPHTFPAGGGLRFVFGGDLDGDSDIDLVTLDRQDETITTLYNESRLTLEPPAYLENLCTAADFHRLSTPLPQNASERRLRFLVRTAAAAPTPAVVLLVGEADNAQTFLRTLFPETYGNLTDEEYLALIDSRRSRAFFVGEIARQRTALGYRYGFDVFGRWDDPLDVPTEEEIGRVHESLARALPFASLTFAPRESTAREVASGWKLPGFPVDLVTTAPTTKQFEAYTEATAIGHIRFPTEEELAMPGGCAFGRSDILVLPTAPRAGVGSVAGVLTTTPQSRVSAVARRAARDGTPNAFVAEAATVLAELSGSRVRIEISADGWTFEALDVEDDVAARAEPVPAPAVDPDYRNLTDLDEVVAQAKATPSDIRFGRFGAAAVSLANARALLPRPEQRPNGFVVPAGVFVDLLQSNRLASWNDPQIEVSYSAFLEEISALEATEAEHQAHCLALEQLRRAILEEAEIPGELVQALSARAATLLQTPGTVLRLQASLNLHAAVEFGRAALYDSATVEDELALTAALRRVWASAYSPAATAARRAHGLKHDQTGVAILCLAAPREPLVRGLALVPARDFGSSTTRYEVWSQRGPLLPTEDRLPAEHLVVEVEEGSVARNERLTPSARVPPGLAVLRSDRVTELSSILETLRDGLPARSAERTLLEVSFHEDASGRLRVDGLEELLDRSPLPARPEFLLEIPEDTVICGTFALAGAQRGLREEYEYKSTLRLLAGTVPLFTGTQEFAAPLLEEVRFGRTRELATATAAGRFEVFSFSPPVGGTVYRFTYEQPFQMRDGRSLRIRLAAPLTFTSEGDEAESRRVLDEEYFTSQPGTEAIIGLLDGEPLVYYGSCTHRLLPQFEIRATLEDGTHLQLSERFLEAASLNETGPASLQGAQVTLGATTRTVDEYWDLVYSAGRHNLGARYWLVLEPPVPVPDLEAPVRIVELIPAEPELGIPAASSAYLGSNFERLRELAVSAIERNTVAAVSFRRGDADSSGTLDLRDALEILEFLLRRGAAPACAKGADANDDGRLNLVDPILIISALFGARVPLPPPSTSCGIDPTPDPLPCERPCGAPPP